MVHNSLAEPPMKSSTLVGNVCDLSEQEKDNLLPMPSVGEVFEGETAGDPPQVPRRRPPSPSDSHVSALVDSKCVALLQKLALRDCLALQEFALLTCFQEWRSAGIQSKVGALTTAAGVRNAAAPGKAAKRKLRRARAAAKKSC